MVFEENFLKLIVTVHLPFLKKYFIKKSASKLQNLKSELQFLETMTFPGAF